MSRKYRFKIKAQGWVKPPTDAESRSVRDARYDALRARLMRLLAELTQDPS